MRNAIFTERLRSEAPANDNRLRAANDNVFAVVSDYDTLGNLNYRSDNLSGVFEYSCDDALNPSYSCDADGNMTSGARSPSRPAIQRKLPDRSAAIAPKECSHRCASFCHCFWGLKLGSAVPISVSSVEGRRR